MLTFIFKQLVLNLFKYADIISYKNNFSPYDIHVLDDSFYVDVILTKSLGLGEAYMDGKFTTPNLEVLITKLNTLNNLKPWDVPFNPLYTLVYGYYCLVKIYEYILVSLFNFQSIILSKKVAEVHYNLPDILYDNMLDNTRFYSCAYFKDTDDLYTAQVAKADLIISKLKIEDVHTILEIGCGWGFIANRIAEQYPKSFVVGITISTEQYRFCSQHYDLPNLSFECKDYRELEANKYDRVLSCGFYEHVGLKNYEAFFNITYNLLHEDGIMLLHTIINAQNHGGKGDPWILKYIFPGGYIPTVSMMLSVVEKCNNFHLQDIEQFGFYYGKTLGCWHDNFCKNWERLVSYDSTLFTEKFKRMWEFYLLFCKVGFDISKLHLVQFVFTKKSKKVYCR